MFKLPELFTFFAMVFGKLKDEKDAMMEAVRESGGQNYTGQRICLSREDSLIDRQDTMCFRDKLSLFIAVLEQCITETGDKAKSLNKLHSALVKTVVAYDHYA